MYEVPITEIRKRYLGAAKLSESDIPKIRRLRKEGMTYKAIAERFGVAQPTIAQIFKGYTWRWVPEEPPEIQLKLFEEVCEGK